MVVVRIEIWPFGNKDKASDLGTGEIYNDGTGDHVTGNYQIRLLKGARYSPYPDAIWRKGSLKGFKREKGPWYLLRDALNSVLKDQ